MDDGATSYVLTGEQRGEDQHVLTFRAVTGLTPRFRFRLDAKARLETVWSHAAGGGSALAGVTGADLPDSGISPVDRIDEVKVPPGPHYPDLPSEEALNAFLRLQRGAATVWSHEITSDDVRGVREADLQDGSVVAMPCYRRTVERLVVTDDDRLLVLRETAEQPRRVDEEFADVASAAAALHTAPLSRTDSRVWVYDRDLVIVAYVDGQWTVEMSHHDRTVTVTLPLDFPAERFRDA